MTPLRSRVGPLVVTSVVHGPHRLGGGLGCRDDPTMGPRALGAALRRWHRHDTETAWEDLRLLDGEEPRLRIVRPTSP